MAKKEGSVAPKERINIRYKPATGEAREDVELPLKMLFMGDYTGRPDPRPLEERQPINIDKDNFEQVLSEQKLSVDLQVAEQLSGEKDASMNVHLEFRKLSDFGPVAITQQVPELRRLMELRSALSALKGPLGNAPAFRKKIQGLLADKDRREALVRELGLSPDGSEEK
jgi:type VI secretion system protein ImpB